MKNLNEYTVPELQEKLEAAGIDFKKSAKKDELINLLKDAKASEDKEDLDESSAESEAEEGNASKDETPAEKVESVESIKIGTRSYKFKEGVKQLQISGEVLPVSKILKDEDTMRSLVRANSPFVEQIKKQ